MFHNLIASDLFDRDNFSCFAGVSDALDSCFKDEELVNVSRRSHSALVTHVRLCEAANWTGVKERVHLPLLKSDEHIREMWSIINVGDRQISITVRNWRVEPLVLGSFDAFVPARERLTCRSRANHCGWG